jgi:ribose transport system substrate-binding protein
MPHRLGIVSTARTAFAACSAFAKDNLSIGIVTFSTSDIHTNQMVDTMTAEAKSKGWTVEPLNANGDPSRYRGDQAACHEEGRCDHCDCFRLDWPCRGTTGGRRRQDTGPDRRGRDGAGDCACGLHRRGSAIGRSYVEESRGSGTVVDLSYHPGIPCRERADAFDAAVKANPGLKATTHEITIPGAAESSQSATSAWLSANANAKGPFAIFNCYDDNATGAIAALKQNGRTDVQVYSFNATAPAVQAVNDGTMSATLGVDLTSAGKLLVEQIPDIIKAGDSWQSKSFIPGYTIVTKDNVDQVLKSNPQ